MWFTIPPYSRVRLRSDPRATGIVTRILTPALAEVSVSWPGERRRLCLVLLDELVELGDDTRAAPTSTWSIERLAA